MESQQELQTVTPYLILEGAARFLQFTGEVFEAQVEQEFRRPENQDLVMHAQVRIGNSILMCADATEQWKANSSGLYINVPDADSTCDKALQAGGNLIMPLSDQDYGRTCGVLDPAGVTWWITSPSRS